MLHLRADTRFDIRKRRSGSAVIRSAQTGKITLFGGNLSSERQISGFQADLRKNNFCLYPFSSALIYYDLAEFFETSRAFALINPRRIRSSGRFEKRRHLVCRYRCISHDRICTRRSFCIGFVSAAGCDYAAAVRICLHFIIICFTGNYFFIGIICDRRAVYRCNPFIRTGFGSRAEYFIFCSPGNFSPFNLALVALL